MWLSGDIQLLDPIYRVSYRREGFIMGFKTSIFAGVSLMMAAVALPTPAYAADKDPIYTAWNKNVAVGGYDAVSFFTSSPVEGKSEFSYDYKGAEWTFSTEANRDLFSANPEAFAPQYGGYCAWAIAGGKLAKGSPKHWTIEDGKLYLNYNKKIKKRWEADKEGFIAQGDAQWPSVLTD